MLKSHNLNLNLTFHMCATVPEFLVGISNREVSKNLNKVNLDARRCQGLVHFANPMDQRLLGDSAVVPERMAR